MKQKRQAKILSIIEQYDIETQDDLVGMLDRGKSVCNHDRSSALHEFCQSTCDKSLGLCVDIGSCLV